ncbi:hypothetical protein HUW51_17035 [Adhaeribacter swui]|uniref:Uncharacterized protein n=1 Tax=Adhaeribacter swui TaxID=2086471 RepID=A0A7G7GB09_9BACT|nr:hypothetical protein [Adhaeribacter swui]QNF34343.1 hypothetical protein HUW51_17035 [Adhaeribacter swui]
MKKYKIFGGGLIEASSFLSLVTQMQNESFTPTDSLTQFMEETSRRCKIQRSAVIRTSSVDDFAKDLITAGFIVEIED